MSEHALVLSMVSKGSNDKELISCIKQTKGTTESLFSYRVINGNNRNGVEVSIKSEIIDVCGFPFKAYVGDNVNQLVEEKSNRFEEACCSNLI